jgi:hypothetical protein
MRAQHKKLGGSATVRLGREKTEVPVLGDDETSTD